VYGLTGWIVNVKELWKVFPGGVVALRGVTFHVERGEVYGLIGPNGAGKSTAFRILATLLKPTSGKALVDGLDVVRHSYEVRKRVTFVPEEVGGHRYMTGREFLEFVVAVYMKAKGASKRDIEAAVEEAIRLSGLSGKELDRRMGEYSKGMKRRLQVAWALAVQPSVAILDEPTTGLDVEVSYEVRSTIKRYASSSGVTVLLSSHNMLEVEAICDRVALIRSGVIVDEGSPSELIAKYGARNLEEAYMIAVRQHAKASTS
jgi:ABC-2 type transport system ATP-binding protein